MRNVDIQLAFRSAYLRSLIFASQDFFPCQHIDYVLFFQTCCAAYPPCIVPTLTAGTWMGLMSGPFFVFGHRKAWNGQHSRTVPRSRQFLFILC